MSDLSKVTLIGAEVPAALHVLNQFGAHNVELSNNLLINWAARRRSQKIASRISETVSGSINKVTESHELYGMEFTIQKKRDRNLIARVLEEVIEAREIQFTQQSLTEEPQLSNWRTQDLALEGLQKALTIDSH